MRKINLLFWVLVLAFASNVYAQDKVYLDFNRIEWVPKAPAYSPTDNAVGGKVAGAEYLIDDNQKTFLALVKAGKSYNGVTGPSNIQDLGFTIEMPEAKLFDYFRIHFNSGNNYHYLRPWVVSVYGSNDPSATFTTGEWTLIKDALGNDKITIQEETKPDAPGTGTGAPFETPNIDLENATAYKFIKVLYEGMSPSASGSTLQVAEFFVGKTTNDRVIEKSADISFGDIMVDKVAEKIMGIKGYNLNTPLSYTLKGDGADAFMVTPKPGAASSTGDTITIKFSPTAKKLYTAKLIINMTGVLEPDTIVLTGNSDFELPVQISDASEHWYYIQFERQATAGKVLTNPVTAGELIKQSFLTPGNDKQMWKVTGTWDNYKVVNKAGEELTYVYIASSENPETGETTPEVSSYNTSATGDSFGFIRYKETESWQLNNISSTTVPAGKTYLIDDAGENIACGALNNAGARLKFIEADKSSYVIPGDTVAIGAVKRNTAEDLTVIVGGLNLTENITITLGDDKDGVYTLKTTSLPSTGGVIEMTFAPKAYKKISYATITLKSASLSESFVVSATSDVGISKYYVYSGETNPWGTRDDGEFVSTIPTLKAEDEVWIAKGEYTVAQIGLPVKAAIYGGFSGTENSIEERALLSGGKAWEFTNATVLKNSASLILSITDSLTIVDGITFEGLANGRAIQNLSSKATKGIIRNCIMKNFNSLGDGGAMNIRFKTEIYNCLITANKANKGGGGYLDNVLIHDCEIIGNSVPTDASASRGNVNGGGGGLLMVASEAYNLYVAENVASYGGGLFPRTTSKVYNSIIVDNTAKAGSGISFDERDSGVMVYNVTVANNISTTDGGAGVNFAAEADGKTQKLYNSILWNNKDLYDAVLDIGITGSVKPSPDIRNVIINDANGYAENIDPCLVVKDGISEEDGGKIFVTGSWQTALESPGVNKGFTLLTEEIVNPDDENDVIPATYLQFATDKDYAGNTRIFGTIDIGPYENQLASSVVKPDAEIEGNVIDTKYYNMQGIEVSTPTINGVYIKKELLDTNKIRATKVLFTNKHTNQ